MTRLFPRLKKFCLCSPVGNACPSFRITLISLMIRSQCASPLSSLRCEDWKACQSPGPTRLSGFHKLLNFCGIVGTMLRTELFAALFNIYGVTQLAKWDHVSWILNPLRFRQNLKTLNKGEMCSGIMAHSYVCELWAEKGDIYLYLRDTLRNFL